MILSSHSILEFLEIAFKNVNLNCKDYVAFDERYLRPAEVDLLIGDPTKAKKALGWEPELDFEGLVNLMVDADLEAIGEKPMNNREAGEGPDIATVRRQMIGSMM
mgnify:FL=1